MSLSTLIHVNARVVARETELGDREIAVQVRSDGCDDWADEWVQARSDSVGEIIDDVRVLVRALRRVAESARRGRMIP